MSIYVAATRQNDGKTTAILGLLEAVQARYPRVGYIKPVGQQVNLIDGHKIDKDASLINTVFGLGGDLPDMSPVAVPRGFTEDYILHGDRDHLGEQILSAYRRVSQNRDFVFAEGTGHAGVGSVFDLSNAAVARLIDAPVIVMTGAGIGRPIDEVMLNKAVFDLRGVRMLGVIVNKVAPEKYDKINDFVRKGFRRHGIEVFGVLPYFPQLANPTLRQLQESLGGRVLNGEENLERVAERVMVGAMPASTIFEYLQGDVFLVTPGNREDLLLAALACRSACIEGERRVRGIILTCGLEPTPTVLRLLRTSDIPIVTVENDTFTTAHKIIELTIKIRVEDREKIDRVRAMVREHVDVDTLMARVEAAAREPRG